MNSAIAFVAAAAIVALTAQSTAACGTSPCGDVTPVSCDAFQTTSLTIGLPIPLVGPISAKAGCELHCVGRGGVVDACAALIGGNCACLEALSADNGAVSCTALQSTAVSIGGLVPISVASACELHCVGNGGVLSGCLAGTLGNCVCLGVDLPNSLPKLPSLPGK